MLSATAVRRKPVPFPGQAGYCVKNRFSPVAVICNGGYRVRTGRGCVAWRLSAAGFCMCGSPVFCVLLHRCLITPLFGGFFGIGRWCRLRPPVCSGSDPMPFTAYFPDAFVPRFGELGIFSRLPSLFSRFPGKPASKRGYFPDLSKGHTNMSFKNNFAGLFLSNFGT